MFETINLTLLEDEPFIIQTYSYYTAEHNSSDSISTYLRIYIYLQGKLPDVD